MRMTKVNGIETGWSKLVDLCKVNTLSSAMYRQQFLGCRKPRDPQEILVRASQRAWQYTIDSPDERLRSSLPMPEAFDVPLSLAEIEGSLTLLHTARTEGKALGYSALEDWQDTQKVLEDYAGFKPEADVTVYFTNEYISEFPLPPISKSM